MIRIALSGATGQVGRALAPAFREADDLELVAEVAPSLGRSLAGVLAAGGVDVVVDFTVPAFAAEACEIAIAHRVPLVLGTTGLGPERAAQVDREARAAGVAILHVANFGIGAILMMQFAEAAHRLMAHAHIIELHADSKRDAPSGTALATARRMGGDVPISSVRLPGLIAHQEVILGGPGETLTIRHDTTGRESFVPGVLTAVRGIGRLPAGLTEGLEPLL
jgi:4-hydroxy-tetrahydrodipicolinate reductase